MVYILSFAVFGAADISSGIFKPVKSHRNAAAHRYSKGELLPTRIKPDVILAISVERANSASPVTLGLSEMPSVGGPADSRAGCSGELVRLQHQAGLAGWGGHHPEGAHPRHRCCVLHPGRLFASSGDQNR